MADVIRIGAFFDGTGNNVWNDELIPCSHTGV